MSNYRITFIKNQIATCRKCADTEQLLLLRGKNYHIEHHEGHMLFALIKANNKDEAKKISKKLVKEVFNNKMN